MEDEKREIRNIASALTAPDEDKRTVEGYAILFNTKSDGLSFEEVIEAGALEGVIERIDVFALLNHDKYRGILARSKRGVGSLTLSVDNNEAKKHRYGCYCPFNDGLYKSHESFSDRMDNSLRDSSFRPDRNHRLSARYRGRN